MNTATYAPRPLLSLSTHIVAIIAVGTLITLVWVTAERSSHQAVQTVARSIAPAPSQITRVTLPAVEVVGRREPSPAKPASSRVNT